MNEVPLQRLNDIPRQKIKEFIAEYGLSLCDDPMRCRGLLLDTCGEYKREINLLVYALEEHTHSDLLSATKGTPYESLRSRIVRRLNEERGLVEDYASWAVDSWAIALGIIPTISEPSAHTASTKSSTSAPPLGNTSKMQANADTPIASGTQSTTKRRSPRTFWLIALAIFIIGLSIFGFTTYQNNVRVENDAATAQSIANATTQAQDQATADTNATATADTNATASVVAANPLPDYLSNSGSLTGTLAFTDILSQPGNWNSQSDTSFGGSCQFMSDGYHTSESHSYSFYNCNDTSSSFANFVFEVKMTINRGDCGGMDLREDTSTGKAYVLFVCSDGAYQFALYTGASGSDETVLKSGNNLGITSGQNTIAVVASGSNFTLYLNNTQFDSVSDSTYSRGEIGLIANDRTNTTEVTYSDARLWTV